ncbi:oxidoreductase, short chain dehydrogenase/reductase family [Drepanopeziza brunnea f. sp. 'multigermtubi' MB_m1]|uniref:D-arabinitol 2-dehydrogenase [ribulose-forming] n=1 Tax=Marssonina brunnea f. sp. multigermtubi (strain MB_m1) TaxID=1072389 RepID=K1XLF2_MARBU|nr:oxidoreductase, short chain dehydrogenase/reductase family [Drepanopeziza brunnea f. sp. 'multigermtubi' MB_m1]EKD13284.1 oxidoreductase, short chain dehydrogenase/reductase family [Drepanopeziza brunnea f. sp. 'multigermtubi' MB_m1]
MAHPPPSAAAAETETPRDALTSRILPQMTFGKGLGVTGPPLSPSQGITSRERAQSRFSVKGNAIITGGAGTLGFEAGQALLEHGLAGLMIFDVNPAQAQAKVDLLQAEFPATKIKALEVDITDGEAVARAVQQTAEILGSVDILLCFAGVVGCTPALDMTAAQWRRTLDINTTGGFLCAQAAAKQMIPQETGGSIVFVASISGHRVNFPQPQVAYNVSKAALISLKNCLAAEWARYGIRVNSISPGYMDTILNEGDGIAEGRAIWAERNPMGRMGVPSELTGAVVLLSSSAGTYMNGTDVVVDGGQILL